MLPCWLTEREQEDRLCYPGNMYWAVKPLPLLIFKCIIPNPHITQLKRNFRAGGKKKNFEIKIDRTITPFHLSSKNLFSVVNVQEGNFRCTRSLLLASSVTTVIVVLHKMVA